MSNTKFHVECSFVFTSDFMKPKSRYKSEAFGNEIYFRSKKKLEASKISNRKFIYIDDDPWEIEATRPRKILFPMRDS